MCIPFCADALKSDQLGIHRAEVLAAASKLLLAILNKLEGTICSQVPANQTFLKLTLPVIANLCYIIQDGRHLEDLKKMVYVLSQVEELYTLIMEHMVSMVTSGVEHLQKCIEGKKYIHEHGLMIRLCRLRQSGYNDSLLS